MITNRPEIKFVSKNWGFEKIIVNTPLYCGKLLFIAAKKKTSLHYHNRKDETFFVHRGKVTILFSDDLEKIKSLATLIDGKVENPLLFDANSGGLQSVTLNAGENFYIPPRRVHRIVAHEDTELYEFSTQHFDDDSKRLLPGG